MLRTVLRASSLVLLFPLVACTELGDDVQRSNHAMVEWADNGTALAALVAVDPVLCGEAGPTLGMSGEVTSTGAASFVELIVELDGVEHARHTLVESGAFQKRDDLKVATIDSQIPMLAGEHAVRLCLGQRGAKGRPQKGACIPEFTYAVDCEQVPVPDTTAPTIVAERDRPPNENGWYNAPIAVTFSCDDAESGVASCTAPVVIASEGAEHFARGQAVDVAGNVVGRAEGPIRLDLTPPTIAFPGARDYLVDEVIEVSCLVGDGLSGVKESQCTAHAGDAFWLPLGSHIVKAAATDLAGNSALARAQYTVSVTPDSLCHLVERFATKVGVANSLCVKLRAAEASRTRGNESALDGQLDAFQNEVMAQSGKALSAAHAAVLIPLADGLRAE